MHRLAEHHRWIKRELVPRHGSDQRVNTYQHRGILHVLEARSLVQHVPDDNAAADQYGDILLAVD